MKTLNTCKPYFLPLQLPCLKEVRHKSRVPPGGYFYYVDPDSGLKISSPYFTQLDINARKHRKANNYPVGANWDDQFEDNVCANTPTAECHEKRDISLIEKASNLANSLWKWSLSGFKVVTEEQYNARMAICQQCRFFGGSKGALKVHCKRCGCSGLKVFLASEICPDNPPQWLPTT